MSEIVVQATTALRTSLSGYSRTDFAVSATGDDDDKRLSQVFGLLPDARSFWECPRQIPSSGDWITFHGLVRKWQSECKSTSSPTKMVNSESYRKIIGMGPKATEMLLAELQRQPDFWFAALRAVTDEDPVPDEARGNIKRMTEAWLDWGVRHGYIKRANGHR
jgi:hypothetical protein